MEVKRKAGGEETWKFTFSPQPRAITDPETVIKDEEVALKMEEIDINMEDVEEATKNTMRDEDFYERERSPKRPRLNWALWTCLGRPWLSFVCLVGGSPAKLWLITL